MFRLLEQDLNPKRFLKPGREAFIDLLNRVSGKAYAYEDVTLSVPATTTSPYVNDTLGLTKITVSVADKLHLKGNVDLTYRRLDLGQYLQPTEEPVYLEVSHAQTQGDVIAWLKKNHYVTLGTTDFSLSSLTANPKDLSTWQMTLNVVTQHPVWYKGASVTVAPANHLGVLLKENILEGFDLPAPCVLESDVCSDCSTNDCGCGCGGSCGCSGGCNSELP